MPRYDFQCQQCGTLYDARLTMAEYGAGKLPPCPDCGGAPKRLIGADVTVLTSWPGPNPSTSRPPRSDGAGGAGGCCAGGSCGCRSSPHQRDGRRESDD